MDIGIDSLSMLDFHARIQRARRPASARKLVVVTLFFKKEGREVSIIIGHVFCV